MLQKLFMLTYNVHHIDYRFLDHLAGRATSSEINSELSAYCRTSLHYFDILKSKNKLRDDHDKVGPWKEIGSAAKWLYLNSWYQHVAAVKTDSALAAIRSTTNIDNYWFTNANVDVKLVTAKNTTNHDIIEVEDNLYLIVTGGFFDLSTMVFVSKYPLEPTNG